MVLPGIENAAEKVNSDLDKGIENNLDAALIKDVAHNGVNYSVVTLTGDVDSQAKRGRAERVAAAVPNVQQVVNELQVMKQKATSSH